MQSTMAHAKCYKMRHLEREQRNATALEELAVSRQTAHAAGQLQPDRGPCNQPPLTKLLEEAAGWSGVADCMDHVGSAFESPLLMDMSHDALANSA
jgi:hypothetical protein